MTTASYERSNVYDQQLVRRLYASTVLSMVLFQADDCTRPRIYYLLCSNNLPQLTKHQSLGYARHVLYPYLLTKYLSGWF